MVLGDQQVPPEAVNDLYIYLSNCWWIRGKTLEMPQTSR